MQERPHTVKDMRSRVVSNRYFEVVPAAFLLIVLAAELGFSDAPAIANHRRGGPHLRGLSLLAVQVSLRRRSRASPVREARRYPPTSFRPAEKSWRALRIIQDGPILRLLTRARFSLFGRRGKNPGGRLVFCCVVHALAGRVRLHCGAEDVRRKRCAFSRWCCSRHLSQ